MVAKASKKPAKKKAARKPRTIGVTEGNGETVNPPGDFTMGEQPKKRGKAKSDLTKEFEKLVKADPDKKPKELAAEAVIVKLGGNESQANSVRNRVRKEMGLTKTRAKKATNKNKVKPLKVSRVRIITATGDSGNNGLLSSGLALLKAAGSFAAARQALDTLEEIRSVKL